MNTPFHSSGFVHRALLYRGDADYVAGVMSFVSEGIALGEPMMVAVPSAHLALLQGAMSRWSAEVHFVDMTELGRNPARIIPAIQEFLNEKQGRPARFVGEPIWPGRTADEIAEATRHESLINLAFSQVSVTVLCPYDLDALPDGTVADAWRTHPEVIAGEMLHSSPQFADARTLCRDDLWPLTPAPDQSETCSYGLDDLAALRTSVHDYAVLNGLGEDRTCDLVLAVNELASNSIRYGGGSGVLRIWIGQRDDVVCEVEDSGHITDPLEGRYPPGPDLEARGLWLVNQLCDLVEVRSGSDGTRVRVRINP
jgi:anti-sigma regulatory factor (Ser/Thr protein kinase)